MLAMSKNQHVDGIINQLGTRWLDAEVSLVFPPTVIWNHGSVYPSTPALTAYLLSQGLISEQVDLNHLFIEYLLERSHLEHLKEDRTLDGRELPLDSVSRNAARILLKMTRLLRDSHGLLRFQWGNIDLRHLLSFAADAYRTDLSIEDIAADSFRNHWSSRVFRDFYESTGYTDKLPLGVHLIGISVPMGPQLVPSVILAQYLKEKHPHIKVVLGGAVMSLTDTTKLDRLLSGIEAIDAVVRFEGEMPLSSLVQQNRSGCWRPDTIDGVSYRKGNKIVHRPPGEGLRASDIPFAQYDIVHVSRIPNPTLGILQARGCYWGQCQYCDSNDLYNSSNRYRTRTAQRVLDEMEYQMQTHGCRSFSLITESLPPTIARKLSRRIIEQRLGFTWSGFAMVDRGFTKETLELMKQAGCSSLTVGVETMIDRVLKLMQKASTRGQIEQFLESARTAGLKLRFNAIIDLPSTTKSDAIESLKGFRKYKDVYHGMGLFPFEATRTSPIGRNPQAFGLLRVEQGSNRSKHSQYASNHLDVFDPAMSDEERMEIDLMYNEFQGEVNNSDVVENESVFVTHIPGKGEMMKFARDFMFEFSAGDRGTLFHHWGTFRNFSPPASWRHIIDLYIFDLAFDREIFLSRFDPREQGLELLTTLVEKRLLVWKTDRPVLDMLMDCQQLKGIGEIQ
ncbi:MAG: radical SAM protein [Proteobacteria bacterium]|nr:radical SAM protein [Pseudomonadota bacterium]